MSLFWETRHCFWGLSALSPQSMKQWEWKERCLWSLTKDQLWWMPWAHSFLMRLAPALLVTLSRVESLQFPAGHSSMPDPAVCTRPWWTFALHQGHKNTRFQRAQEPGQSDYTEKTSAVSLSLKASIAMLPSSSQVHVGTGLTGPGAGLVWNKLVWSHLSA